MGGNELMEVVVWAGGSLVFTRERNKGKRVLSRRQGRKVGWMVRRRRRKDVMVHGKERGG